jgi:hypothetical protein
MLTIQCFLGASEILLQLLHRSFYIVEQGFFFNTSLCEKQNEMLKQFRIRGLSTA